MITLTHLPNRESIHVAPSAIVVVSRHPDGGSFLLLAFGPATQVSETPDEVRAMVEAALRPAGAADAAAAREAADLLRRLACGMSLGVGRVYAAFDAANPGTSDGAAYLRALADRLAAP